MKVLVTGCNGFVGSRLSAELHRRGHQVIGIGRQSLAKAPGIAYVRHDLSAPLPLMTLEDSAPLGAVVHCAALASPWANPRAYVANNVTATENILAFCENYRRPHFVFISSSSVFYRDCDQFGISETSPIPEPAAQINHYSRSKLAGERLTQRYPGPWTILRPRAVFGPGDTVLLPRIIQAAEKGRLVYFVRRDRKRASGDLIYIDTLVSYICNTLERRVTGDFNLTNNESVVMADFIDSVLSRLGLALPGREVSVAKARLAARTLELVSKYFLRYREPPITRFGVSVLAYSKTFDVSKTLEALGPPLVPISEGVEMLTEWWRNGGSER